MDYLKQVLLPNAFEAFFIVAFSIKLYFVWEKNKVHSTCMLVNNECSSWYNRVGDFLLLLVWDRRKKILYGDGSACGASQTYPIPECEGHWH